MRERFKGRKTELKGKVGELETQLERVMEEKTALEGGLAALKKVEEQLRATLKKAEDAIASQQSELSQKSLEIAALHSLRQSELQHLSKKLRTKVSLDDTGLEHYTTNDAPTFSYVQLVFVTQQKAKDTVGKCDVLVSALAAPVQKLLEGLESRFDLFRTVEDSRPMRLAADKVTVTQTWAACGKLKASVSASIGQLITFLKLLYTLEKGPRDLQNGRFALIEKLKITVAHLKTFSSFFLVFQKAEAKLVQNPQELKQINSELASATGTILRLFEDFCGAATAGFCLSKKSAWSHAVKLSKSLHVSTRQISIVWAKRLAMDPRLQYPQNLRAVKAMNEGVLSSLTNVVSVFDQICSAGALLEDISDSCWFFLLSPFYSRGRRYLETIRQDSPSEGVPYLTALSNVESLRQMENALEEQKLEVASLEKQLADSHKEEEKIKATVRRMQNDMLVLASATQETQLSDTKPLAREPDTISEDVRNGIQRMAARLIDFGGEALPIEKLTVEQDLLRQLRSRAVETIRQLSGSLLVAEKKIAALERDHGDRKSGVKSPPPEPKADPHAEVSSQKSMSQKST